MVPPNVLHRIAREPRTLAREPNNKETHVLKKALVLGCLAAVVAGLSASGCVQEKPGAAPAPAAKPAATPTPAAKPVATPAPTAKPAATPAAAVKPAGSPAPAAGGEVVKIAFGGDDALKAWKITGDVKIDAEKSHTEKAGSLKIGPGGKAVLKLRDKDGAGKVEMWVFDDGTKPANAKAGRQGPRWAIAQADGKKQLDVGILYQSYLGGDEGYTATVYTGGGWYTTMVWMGINRAPVGWHKWTFDMDPEKGLRVLHNDKAPDLAHFDPAKMSINGFNSIVLWGDGGKGDEQTFWVADITATLGGDVKSVPTPAPTPTPKASPAAAAAEKAKPINVWTPSDQKVVMYTKDKAPAAPKLEDLPLQEKVTQYGITWTFDKPARVGQFVNGDFYVVGPVTVVKIDPKPLYGAEIPDAELGSMDKERKVEQRVRNGFMLNPPAQKKVAYDSGIRNWFDASLIQKLPVSMKPTDSLVSTISMPAGVTLVTELGRNNDTRGEEDASPIRTAAILTCVAAPLPPDAFRPGFTDPEKKVYFSHDLKRELLPTVEAVKGLPDIKLYVRYTQRPWVGTCFFGFEIPVENMPWYGLEHGRVSGNAALMLCTDAKPEDKEPLLVDFTQVGIDLGGMIKGGNPGFEGFGGHGSGRKLPIVFAGLLLGDDAMANISKTFSKASFGEDEQTAYGDTFYGAKVMFTGHRGIDTATGIARPGTGPYEQKAPKDWTGKTGHGGDVMSESYRRCCTSRGWISEALAMRLMKAEKAWGHDPFFDYCDRWMTEDEAAELKALKADLNLDEADWAQEGHTEEKFVMDMWAKHRNDPGMPPTDGWKKQHDDSYLKNAMEKAPKQ
jgi:hypothetical protein